MDSWEFPRIKLEFILGKVVHMGHLMQPETNIRCGMAVFSVTVWAGFGGGCRRKTRGCSLAFGVYIQRLSDIARAPPREVADLRRQNVRVNQNDEDRAHRVSGKPI